MEKLLRGLARFQADVFPDRKPLFEELACKQYPVALFITCADSRIVPDLITQSDPGDLFICRNAGNMVPPYGELLGGVSATIEYAVSALDVKHIIVCGHSDCGAMQGCLHPERVRSMPAVASWMAHGERARRIVLENHPGLSEDEQMAMLTRENVAAQLENLRTHPPVAVRLARGALEIHGWVYDIRTGGVVIYDQRTNRFVAFGGRVSAGGA
jgi:carbonic anhydrase